MKDALSSFVRTRRKIFFSLFTILILINYTAIFQPVGWEDSLSFSPPQIPLKVSDESEVIDSFNVHPANRYTETDIGGGLDNPSVANGIFNMSTTSSGITEGNTYRRPLSNLDDKIEFKFRVDSNQVSGSESDFSFFGIDNGTETTRMGLSVSRVPPSNGEAKTFLRFYDIDGVEQLLRLDQTAGFEIVEGLWYVFILEFDILRSEAFFTVIDENDVKLFKKSFVEIDNTERPVIFEKEDIFVQFTSQAKSVNYSPSYLLDYIKAPFKENTWRLVDDTADPQWTTKGITGHTVEDDVDDNVEFQLTVPYLDSFTAELEIDAVDSARFDQTDAVDYFISLYTVDFDDGDLALAAIINIELHGFAPGGVAVGNVEAQLTTFTAGAPSTDNDYVKAKFSIALFDDRSGAEIQIQGVVGDSGDSYGETIGHYQVDFSDVSADFSSEFVIAIEAVSVITGNSMDVSFSLLGFELDKKWIFEEIIKGVQSVGDWIIGVFVSTFTILFLWLGNIFKAAISALEPFLSLISTAITTMQAAITSAVGAVTTAVEAVTTAIGELAAGIATAVWEGIGDALDFITSAISGIAAAIWVAMGTAAEALGQVILDIGTAIFALLSDILEGIITFLAGLLFFLWDALSLPDLLALANELIVLFGQLIDFLIATLAQVIQLAVDFSWLILVGWWVWAIPIQWAGANFDPISGIGGFIEVFFYDIFPWNILGFHAYIPQGVVFTLWLILLLPGDFAIFTAMS